MNRSAYLLGEEDPDLPGQIEAAGRAGFGSFGADAFSIARYVREGGSVEELAERIEAAGMRTFELPTLAVNLDRAETRREIDRLLEIGRILRPDFVQVNVDSEVDAGVLDDLRQAAERFGEIEARLAIEYLPWLPAIRDIESTRNLIGDARADGAGVLVDSWHFTHGADTWEILASLPLDELAYVQFDDHPALESTDLIEETLMRRAMPGEGVFELDRFCEAFRNKGYDGVVSCEILSAETRRMDLDEFACRVFETSHRFWS